LSCGRDEELAQPQKAALYQRFVSQIPRLRNNEFLANAQRIKPCPREQEQRFSDDLPEGNQLLFPAGAPRGAGDQLIGADPPGPYLDFGGCCDGTPCGRIRGNERPLAKTFALAIDEAAKLHPASEPLLVHAALLTPEPIPVFLFAEARDQLRERVGVCRLAQLLAAVGPPVWGLACKWRPR
jgi:hypothetical protein